MTGCSVGAGKALPWIVSTYTTDSPLTPDTFPLMVPALAASVTTRTANMTRTTLRFMGSPWKFQSLRKFRFSIDPFQSSHGLIGAERVRDRIALGVEYSLLRPDLVLK